MKRYIRTGFLGLASALMLTSCLNDLDQFPIDPDSFTEQNVFASADEAKGALAKLYASLALTGQQGPTGQPDITGVDEGSTQFTRALFYMQELTTDNAILAWNDAGAPDFHSLNWTSSNVFVEAMYYRLGQQVSFTNSFIANAAALSADSEVQAYIAEARFLRAYAYLSLLDMFGNVPLVTQVQSELPSQSSRRDIFNFVESELIAIESELKPARTNEYGRVDAVAAQALLSRLYLNAQVYIGEDRYTDCITYANKVIASSYSLNTTDGNGNGTAYDELFLADNDTNGAQNEFIFALNFDGINSRTWGGTAFLIHGATGGSMNPAPLGVNGGWGGMRATKEMVMKFPASATNAAGEPTAWNDKRAMFYTSGQTYEISSVAIFTEGYALTKFKNVTTAGVAGKDPAGDFPDTDLPIIRLAEIYLNYAEAVLRGGSGGDAATALGYVNQLRQRGYGNASGNITAAQLTLDFVLDERARELYWEGFRRSDLIRYNRFTTGDYLWTFKGGSANGASVGAYRRLFPIPANAILTNRNLTQNDGY
ncbi:MAG: RagB/SusD family nutrient uptake outer membrane protein [Capnocytophaga sp.]|nr:RagB/SusD family nutrient uptake outer membrane protein [Capnocytophaga sp.]